MHAAECSCGRIKGVIGLKTMGSQESGLSSLGPSGLSGGEQGAGVPMCGVLEVTASVILGRASGVELL